jgi:phosphoglycerol transferase MdoB-like AlkP superfamily enzyme
MRQTRLALRRLPARKRPPLTLWQSVCISAILGLAALALCLGMEWMTRGSFTEVRSWMEGSRSIFLLNAMLTFFLLLLCYGMIGSLLPAMATATLLLSVGSLISYFKTRLIGEPFFPWDILLNQEGMNIAPLVTGSNAYIRIGGIVLVIAALVLLRVKLGRFAPSWWSRLGLVLVAAAGLVSFAFQSTWANRMLNQAGVAQIIWNQQENYGNNGFALAFTLNVKNSIITKPTGYGEQAIDSIAAKLTSSRGGMATAAADTAEPSGKLPHVIFVMSEAFWDPTLLPGVTFSEDPLPTIHRLQERYGASTMLTPQFGGGTSNVEFEVLTGFSTSFLPSGSVPYQQYISQPIPSLASFFEGRGYRSLAVHSYEGWFWNRNNVYKWMGFEGFKSLSHFTEPEYKGAFIADSEVSRSIIREVEKSEDPVFIYAVTMQNHGPYNDDRYGQTDIAIDGDLTDEAKQIINTYTQGAKDADASLKTLIDYFEEKEEPAYIVFYGDHLPMLGYDYDVYRQTGFIGSPLTEEWSLEELRSMRSVPLVTWTNVPVKADLPATISSSFLGSFALKALGIEPAGQFALNAELYPSLPGLLRNLTIDSGETLSGIVPEEASALVEDYRLLQYDMLFGNQYLAGKIDEDFLGRLALPAYNIMDAEQPALR